MIRTLQNIGALMTFTMHLKRLDDMDLFCSSANIKSLSLEKDKLADHVNRDKLEKRDGIMKRLLGQMSEVEQILRERRRMKKKKK